MIDAIDVQQSCSERDDPGDCITIDDASEVEES